MLNTADNLSVENNSAQIETSAWENDSDTNEIILPFSVREKFRPQLMIYFEMTTKRSGAYVWAEQKTLDYFESLGIPRSAWNYRSRSH